MNVTDHIQPALKDFAFYFQLPRSFFLVPIKRLLKGVGANASVYAHPVRRGPLIGPRKRDIVYRVPASLGSFLSRDIRTATGGEPGNLEKIRLEKLFDLINVGGHSFITLGSFWRF